jgi:hypothetical protein
MDREAQARVVIGVDHTLPTHGRNRTGGTVASLLRTLREWSMHDDYARTQASHPPRDSPFHALSVYLSHPLVSFSFNPYLFWVR